MGMWKFCGMFLKKHMGRSEAPLSRDQREETPGFANRNQLSLLSSKNLRSEETMTARNGEKSKRR